MKKIVLLICFISLNASSINNNYKRYFGGYSQNEVLIIKSNIYTVPLIVTEEVFNAKTSADIDRVIKMQQFANIVNGVAAKEFLEDKNGHLYGGISENNINLKH